MLAQFFSNEKVVLNENKQYFNISTKEKMILDLRNQERNIVKHASENVRKSLIKINK
jgi:hypothetical protein